MNEPNGNALILHYLENLKHHDQVISTESKKNLIESGPNALPLIISSFIENPIDWQELLPIIHLFAKQPVLRYQITQILLNTRDDKAVSSLILLVQEFANIDCGIVYAAAHSLGEIGNIIASEFLLRALKNCNGTGVGTLYAALSKLGSPLKPVLLNAITQGDQELREGASYALIWFIRWGGYEKEREIILAAVSSPLIYCRITAIDALGKLGNISDLPLLKNIYTEDKSKRTYMGKTIRQAALEAINNLEAKPIK